MTRPEKRVYKDYTTKYAEFWNKCGKGYAHIDERFSKLYPIEGFKKSMEHFGLYGNEIDLLFKDQVVVDYGMGSGRLGVVTWKIGAKKYIGIDVSKRQLNYARSLVEKNGVENYEFLKAPVEFADLQADVFNSQGCMQHFPSEQYLQEFLQNINRSGIHHLLLQYRYAEAPKFVKDNYAVGCRINSHYAVRYLNNYQLRYVSKPVPKNSYQFTRWEHNEAVPIQKGRLL